ncbi:MAG TPA: hypothetical protein VH854_07410, partial [Thermoanaerobaculia bacterium]|nr:hypothetical protein [Thermoanaerobaculia bacterium]
MYQPRLEPRDYQVEALDKMVGRRAFALLMRPRTGKTKVALDDFGRLEDAGDVDDLLVVAPAGVYLTWLDELDKQFTPEFRGCVAVHAWRSGRSWKKAKPSPELKEFLTVKGPRVFLVNVEALSLKKSGAR